MGFLEYARSMLFEKDELKIKLSVSPKFQFPQFFRDEVGFVIVLPEPIVREVEGEEKTVSLMGYCFPLIQKARGNWGVFLGRQFFILVLMLFH